MVAWQEEFLFNMAFISYSTDNGSETGNFESIFLKEGIVILSKSHNQTLHEVMEKVVTDEDKTTEQKTECLNKIAQDMVLSEATNENGIPPVRFGKSGYRPELEVEPAC